MQHAHDSATGPAGQLGLGGPGLGQRPVHGLALRFQHRGLLHHGIAERLERGGVVARPEGAVQPQLVAEAAGAGELSARREQRGVQRDRLREAGLHLLLLLLGLADPLAEYVGYATPNAAAKKLLPKDILDDKAFYPSDQAMKNLEVYKNLGPEYLGIYNDLFLSIKMYRK